VTTSARRDRRPSVPDVRTSDVGSGDGLDRRDGDGASDVPDADPESVARTIGRRQLSVTARTRSELATTLAKRNVPEAAATRVLDRMVEVGLVDDAAYAHEWVRIRQSERGLARRALAAELRRKGIDDESAAAALAGVSDDDEVARARELVVRKARAMRGQPVEAQTRRLAGMLARKGYSSGTAFAVVREVLQAESLATEPDHRD
jgi:regulatory protein